MAKLVSRIPELIAGSEQLAAAVVDKTAHDIAAGCKERSRVDTGQMRDGWQVFDGHDALEREVGNPVEHTIYNEFGTVHMSAQPMLTPSVEEARAGFVDAMSRLYR